MQVQRFDQYQDFLGNVLEMRQRQNPKYSMRAFARDLDLSPSRVSEILNRKKGISHETACQIGSSLGLSEAETYHLCDLVQLQHARSDQAREMARKRVNLAKGEKEFTQLDHDAFAIISDWYHYAIIELTTVDGFVDNEAWIASRLDITLTEARLAVERLLRLGLLVRESSTLVKTSRQLTTTNEVPSEAIRSFHRQILAKAEVALEQQPVGERDYSTITVATSKTKIAEAKRRIGKFRRSLLAFLEEHDSAADEVYCLALEFFRLTQKEIK